MEDHHVDRLEVEAWQHVQLTSTNRSIGLITPNLTIRLRPNGEITTTRSEQETGEKASAKVLQLASFGNCSNVAWKIVIENQKTVSKQLQAALQTALQ